MNSLLTIESVLKPIKKSLGEEDYREPLEILLRDLSEESNLLPHGYLGMRTNIINRLKVRADLYEVIKNQELPPPATPIIVAGLPRSGTTFLFDLLHADSTYRSPLTWEIFYPLPLAQNEKTKKERKRKTNTQLSIIKFLVPDLNDIHPLDASLPEECQQITTICLRSIAYALMARTPNYKKYLKTCDFSSALLWHTRFLQVLEQTNKPIRWLLKDPTHIHHIPELLSAYPGAYFVFIHRDPTASIPSICSLSSKITSALSTRADKEEIGKSLLDYWGHAIEKNLVDRAQIPDNRIFDVHFTDFISDPMEQIKQMYAHFGFEINQENEENMNNFLVQETANKTPSHNYILEEFGLKAKQVRERFKEYTTQFDL